ncbi:class I SAM-dependent methyltransferase, partial [Segeticoccus rhizosphaerae]|uniref:methyltransferase domain-containing protein n=1 Tax=Segeticoccus rhizosphaerae TaxID=1104777 RepID=UPI001265724C
MTDDAMVRRARSFEQGAGAYDRLRPEFPEQMFDDLAREAGDLLRRPVLEVGAGTGRATLPLVRRGARVVAVEPSADMLR